MQEEKKKCPFCGEEILKVAIKCKYCGSILDGSDQEKKITISGVDPFAELHTPIKGKTKGKLTLIGKLIYYHFCRSRRFYCKFPLGSQAFKKIIELLLR